MAETEAENACLEGQLQHAQEEHDVCQLMMALLSGGNMEGMDAEDTKKRFLQMSLMFARLKANAPPAGAS